MRIWFDTEFQDNGRTIEMISLGAVRESDSSCFYCEADWVDLDLSSDWVKANVHPHLTGPKTSREQLAHNFEQFCRGATEFWADSPAYDWVAVSQLWGSMLDRPDGWPYNAWDLRQFSYHAGVDVLTWPEHIGSEHNALADADHHRSIWHHIDSHKPDSDG